LKVDESLVGRRHGGVKGNGNTTTLFSLNGLEVYVKKKDDK
jgi:hypothetical protein